MNNIFFTADHHFDHANVIFHCDRPWLDRDNDLNEKGMWKDKETSRKRVNEMNEALIEIWNSTVGPKDLVYHLGDFAWRNHMHFFHALNGRKILFVGNHDKMSREALAQWTEVHYWKHILIEKQQVFCSHFQVVSWPGVHRGVWHAYAHSHGRSKEHEDRFATDVGVDVWSYQPIPWEALKLKMSEKISRQDSEDHFSADQYAKDLNTTNKRYLEAYYVQEGSNKSG